LAAQIPQPEPRRPTSQWPGIAVVAGEQHNQCPKDKDKNMNFNTQIKCTVAALALFTAVGVTALTRAETVDKPATLDVVHTRIEISAATSIDADNAPTARVHVGNPIAVDANPTSADIERASR